MSALRRAWMYLSQPEIGGAQISTIVVADDLKTSGWRLDFSFSYDGSLVAECRLHGHEPSWVPMPEWYRFLVNTSLAFKAKWLVASLVLMFRLFRKLRKERPDLIYLLGRRDIMLCAPAAFLLRIPMIYHLHGLNPEFLPYEDRVALAFARALGAPLVCNSKHTEGLARKYGWKGKTDVIYNGINFDPSYEMDKSEARRRFGIAPEELVIGCGSRISPGKNIDGLLRMFAHLQGLLGRPLLLLIAGGEDTFQRGRLLSELKALAAELGIESSVRWLGHLREMGPFYRALDLFVSLTEVESFGRVFVESMAAGVLTLATRVGGVPEIISDGVDGVFVPVKDPDRAAEIAAELLRDPERAARLARAGRESSRSRFSPESHTARMVKVFEEAITHKPRR